jgi:hypothetical protein
MAYETKPNSGALFKNDKQREGHKDPNAQGRVLLARELIEDLYRAGGNQLIAISAWTRKSEAGKPWQSLAVRPWENFGNAAPAQQQQSAPDAFDDDIPF